MLYTKGEFHNEFGEVVGKFWYRPSTMSYTRIWHGLRSEGWTLEGLKKWADKLEYYLVATE